MIFGKDNGRIDRFVSKADIAIGAVLHRFDVARLPALVDDGFCRGVEPQDREVTLPDVRELACLLLHRKPITRSAARSRKQSN